MKREYKNVFDITLKNSFYTDGLSPDFELLPSPETQDQMRRFRLKMRPNLKKKATQFYFGQEAYEGGSPVVGIPDNTSFVFYLRSVNYLLQNFTDLPTGMGGGDVLYFNNRAGSDFLHVDQDHPGHVNNMVAYRLRKRIFQYNFSQGAETGITLKVMEDATLRKTILMEGTNGNFQVGLDLSDLPKGKYDFVHTRTSDSASLGGLDHTNYLDESAVQAGAIGVVRIDKTASLPLQDKHFVVDFLMRSERWKYFVAVKNDVDHEYFIEEGVISPTLVFSDATGGILPDSPDDHTVKMLEANNPGAVVYLFVSDTFLDYQQAPPLNIALFRQEAGLPGTKTKVLSNLSAPSLSNSSPEVVVCVTKPETLQLV